MFYDEYNKESHDSNHAVLYPEKITALSKVLDNIRMFYTMKGIAPTIYHPFVKDYFAKNERTFSQQGFDVSIGESHHIFVLSEASRIVPNNSLEIRKLTEWDERIGNDILIPNDEAYEISVVEKTMRHASSHLFVGYKGEKAVTFIQFHVSSHGCTRFDYIDTAKDERGKGYARQISHRVVSFCREEKLPLPAAWFANEASERLNFEAGFRPTDLWLENGYATYEEIAR